MKKVVLSLLISFFTSILLFLSCKKEKSCEGCTGDNNKPPTAIAGLDKLIILPTDSVLLDGSSSNDPDGTISDWLWTKISGPASFNLINNTSSVTAVKNLVAGVYEFELKVTDNDGLFAKDTVQITVNNTGQLNRSPVANAGPDQIISLPVNQVLLDASGSTDPDNNIMGYRWVKVSGPTSFAIVNAIQAQANNLVMGVYEFELRVTDSGGLFSTDRVKVYVMDSTNCTPPQADWEVIVTLPINYACIDDYYRDAEGTCLQYICGPSAYRIDGWWVRDLVPGVYYFKRYWIDCVTAAEIIKVIVLNDPGDQNTITYKKLKWEYNFASNNMDSIPHLFLSRPRWPGNSSSAIDVFLQMDWLNNGQWLPIPSNNTGYEFRIDCNYGNNVCLEYFLVKVNPENSSWQNMPVNLKIRLR